MGYRLTTHFPFQEKKFKFAHTAEDLGIKPIECANLNQVMKEMLRIRHILELVANNTNWGCFEIPGIHNYEIKIAEKIKGDETLFFPGTDEPRFCIVENPGDKYEHLMAWFETEEI